MKTLQWLSVASQIRTEVFSLACKALLGDDHPTTTAALSHTAFSLGLHSIPALSSVPHKFILAPGHRVFLCPEPVFTSSPLPFHLALIFGCGVRSGSKFILCLWTSSCPSSSGWKTVNYWTGSALLLKIIWPFLRGCICELSCFIVPYAHLYASATLFWFL